MSSLAVIFALIVALALHGDTDVALAIAATLALTYLKDVWEQEST